MKRLWLAAATLLMLMMWPLPAQAADFDYKIASTYTLNQNRTVEVRVIVDVINNVSTPSPSSIVLPTAAPASEVTAAYQDGAAFTSNYSPESQSIRLETTANQSGQGRQWSLVVNYQVDALSVFGDTLILSVPPLDYGNLNVLSEEVSLLADLALGVALPRGDEPDSSRIVAGQQVYRWVSSGGPLTSSTGMLFGDNAVAEVRYQTTLKNNSWWWQDKIVTLPADTNQQRVFLNSIEPQPTRLSLDVDGNILATYRLRPQASVTVNALATLVVSNFSYNLDIASVVSETPAELVDRYTSLNDTWKGSLAAVESESAAERTEFIYRQVSDSFAEQEFSYENSLSAAQQLVGELRAQQVPARLVLGYTYGDGGQIFDKPQKHAWTEAYLAGVGWMTLDPLFETAGEFFGVSDVQHVALMLRGIEPDFPPEFLDSAQVSYTENDVPETPDMKPRLSAVKHMILPGLAIQSINASLPSGMIVDGSGLLIGGQSLRPLGSLAPLQTVSLRTLAVGPAAFSAQSVAYGPIADGGLGEELDSTTFRVNYLPMIIILAAALLAVAARFFWRRRHPKREKVKRSRDAVVFASEEGGDNIEHANLIPDAPAPPPLPPEAPRIQPPDSSGTITEQPSEADHQRPTRRRRIQ